MINKFTHAVLLVWAGVHIIQSDYQGSRRQAVVAVMRGFPHAVVIWRSRLIRAYRYSETAKHKRVSTPVVREKEPENYRGKRRAPRGHLVVAEPFLPPDPYQAARRNIPAMNAKEGTHEYVSTNSSFLGRDPHPAGGNHRAAESVLPREGRSGYRRLNRVHRGRRVQWAAEGLQARVDAVFDLVQEGLPDQRKRGRHARPGLWRLPSFTRRGELAATL